MSSQIITSVTRRSSVLFSGLRQNIRCFSSTPAPVETPKPAAAAAPSTNSSNRPNAANHKVDNLERKVRLEKRFEFSLSSHAFVFLDACVDRKVQIR
jgi:hypothetical protein